MDAGGAGEKKEIYRRDRIQYIIQGGMSAWAAQNILNVDVPAIADGLLQANESLSSYTHVNEATFNLPKEGVNAIVGECLVRVTELVDGIAECKNSLIEFLEPVYDGHVLGQFLYETHQNLDELSTHHWIDEYDISNVVIEKINADSINVEVEGSVTVGMQYGSDSDMRRGDGIQTSASWPFNAQISVRLIQPLGSKSDLVDFYVDTREWSD